MFLNEKARAISFLSEIVGDKLDIIPLYHRIDVSDIPGTYEFEYVSISLSKRIVKSATIYLIEPPYFDSKAQIIQRYKTLDYYRNLFPKSTVEQAFENEGRPLRIDPSFKSSDNDSILRIEPQVRTVSFTISESLERFV